MKRTALALILALAAAGPALAELETAVELTALSSLTRDAAGGLVIALLGKGDLAFRAAAHPNVKAEAELAGVWSRDLLTPPADLLKRLFLKVDFGGVYLLAGKARVSWGEGFAFNAGDVVFGSLTPAADFTASLLRDQTDWLADLTLPLGAFSYIEALFLPYSPLAPAGFPEATVYQVRGGGRFVTDIAGLKLEAGYLFKADEAAHHPYLSLQGNLFFDCHLSASLKVPALEYTDEKLFQGLALSAGLFRLFTLPGGGALSLRLEAACRPAGLWQEPAASSQTDVYGLLLYPEIVFSPMEDVAVGCRAMINPIDASGVALVTASFGIFQGFDLIAYLWTMWGDADDLYFGFGRPGDMGLSIGLTFIY